MEKSYLLQNIVICTSLFFIASGCAMANKLYPLPKTDVKIISDKIYHKDKLFAELRYLGNMNSAQGLSIFYYQYRKEIS